VLRFVPEANRQGFCLGSATGGETGAPFLTSNDSGNVRLGFGVANQQQAHSPFWSMSMQP
jgi:hypothetical protein